MTVRAAVVSLSWVALPQRMAVVALSVASSTPSYTTSVDANKTGCRWSPCRGGTVLNEDGYLTEKVGLGPYNVHTVTHTMERCKSSKSFTRSRDRWVSNPPSVPV